MGSGLTGQQWTRQVRRDWIDAALGWERNEARLLYSLAAVDSFLVRALDLAPRQRVLDFACGSGEPSLAIAPLVSPGPVLGLDLSAPMLAIARRRAKTRGIRNVRFRRGDIARARLLHRFDRIVSRYGLMFVEDIPGTLARLRAMLKPGGRIALAVWGPIERNALYRIRAEAARPFMKAPPPDPERVPGPLRLSRPGRLARLLRLAGFSGVRAEGVHAPFVYQDEAEYFEINFGVHGPLKNLYDSLGRADRAALHGRVVRALRPYRDGELLRLPGFAWVVSGRRPRSLSRRTT